MLFKKKNLAIFIYVRKINNIEKKEFKKLIISSGIFIDKFINIHVRYPNKKYYLGIGNLEKIYNIIKKYGFVKLLINFVLKSTQENNLKKFLKCSILNRTNIILNIFKKRANTSYGKLQVKLAYLNYLSTRLTRRWSHLERQKGGMKYISGPGEKQIEIDRRIIKKKIKNISFNINKISLQKDKSEKLRNKLNIPLISLVGYTNSGKSTLFNLLTNSDLKSDNVLFSTLDTYIKKIRRYKFYCDILISDTVGFIRNLPKNIFNAFKSTFSEILKSKLILHIIDISNIYFQDYINTVNIMLNNINIKNIPIVQVMNKIDMLNNCNSKIEFNYENLPYKIWISAKKKLGINYIYDVIKIYLFSNLKKYKICIPLKLSFKIRKYLYKNNFINREWSYDGKYYFFEILLKEIDYYFFLKKFYFVKNFLINI